MEGTSPIKRRVKGDVEGILPPTCGGGKTGEKGKERAAEAHSTKNQGLPKKIEETPTKSNEKS